MSPFIPRLLGVVVKYKRLFFIPNSSDPDKFNPAVKKNSLFPVPEKNFVVLWSGNIELTWHQGQLIREIAEKISKTDNSISCVFLTRREFFNYEMPSNSVILDDVSYEEIPKYFASAVVCLCLYMTRPWVKWGFYLPPLKLYDYKYSGYPVIAAVVG